MGRTGDSVRRLRRRAILVEIQGGLCAHCFEPMDPPRPLDGPYNPRAATMDEVRPRAGGGKLAGNTVAVHEACNGRKDRRPPTGCELVVLAWVNAALVERPSMAQDRVVAGLPGSWKAWKKARRPKPAG